VHARAPFDDARALARAVESALARCTALELIASLASSPSTP
jgi:hypothetical protein